MALRHADMHVLKVYHTSEDSHNQEIIMVVVIRHEIFTTPDKE